MSLRYICFLMVLLSCVFVVADSGSFIVGGDYGVIGNSTSLNTSCGSIESSAKFTADYPLYYGLNESRKFTIYVQASDGVIINNSLAVMQIQVGTDWYNMTFSQDSWYVYISSDVQNETSVMVRMASTTYKCINETYTLRFYEPIYVDIWLYEYRVNGSEDNKLIKRSNTFIGMKPESSVNVKKWFPSGFTFLGDTVKYDETEGYWGAYVNGKARVKVYKPGTYRIFVLNTKVNPLKYTGDEFVFPHINGIEATLLTTISSVNTTNNQFEIMLSPIEKHFSLGIMYMFKLVLAIVLWLLFMVFLSYMIPNSNVLFAIGIPTFLFAIGAVTWLW